VRVTAGSWGLPFLLPLVVVILSAVSRDGIPAGTGERNLLPPPFDRHRQVHGYR